MRRKRSRAARIAVFIRSNTVGRGDDELGSNLMMNYLHQLSVGEVIPEYLILMNSGVTLAAQDSDVLESLKELSKRGAEILSCGTCLDFFRLRDRLEVGRPSNMKEITEILLSGATVITI